MRIPFLCVVSLAVLFFVTPSSSGAERILIVQDELPQMEFLARLLSEKCGYETDVKTQSEMPAEISGYKAVIVYIHGRLFEEAEKAFIAYAKGGGKLILLHHSISSGKRQNKFWFDFLGVKLPEGEWEKGGYKWIEPVGQTVVNINPGHYITSKEVKYEGKTSFQSDKVKAGGYPCFRLKANSEVYLNHKFSDGDEKTLLLGFIYEGEGAGGRKVMQNTSGWLKKAGNGWLIYLQPGHLLEDFKCEAYQQIILNAIRWKPDEK
jgi:hypothetical protein